MELTMKMKSILSISLILGWVFLSSCEDIIDVQIEQKQKKIVVDAFIDNAIRTQRIRLTESIPYFDSSKTEPPVSDAQVVLADTGSFKLFNFTYKENGYYEWEPNPASGDTLQVGRNYALLIIQGGDTIVGVSRLNPTIDKIDSIRTVPVKGNGPPFIDSGKYIELFAKDRPGMGDFYWIKLFRNDTQNSRLNNLNISQDMGNNSNGQDGDYFIYPVRFNRNNEFLRPYRQDEKVRIEVYSINRETFYWFQIIQNQANNGGLFATPPVNIQSNMFMLGAHSGRGVAGFYNVGAVVGDEIIIQE